MTVTSETAGRLQELITILDRPDDVRGTCTEHIIKVHGTEDSDRTQFKESYKRYMKYS